MRRRDLFGALSATFPTRSILSGALAFAAPKVRSQSPRRVGFLTIRSQADFREQIDAFRQGLAATGHVEGQNVTIEYRFGDGHYDQLPALAADLVRMDVSVIAAPGGLATARAAKAATTTIPIVFVVGSDPVELGLVASLNRPGGNVTGVGWVVNALTGKQVEFLLEIVPEARTIALLVNPLNPSAERDIAEAQSVASRRSIGVFVVKASTETEVEVAFEAIRSERVGGLVVHADAFLLSRQDQIIRHDAQSGVPAVYVLRDFVTAGGLMSYGTSLTQAVRLAGSYTGEILNGAQPAELPVQQSTRVELVLNLRTAQRLGLAIPVTLLGRADEVIE